MARGKNIDISSDDAKHAMVIHRANMEDYGVEVVAQAEEERSTSTLFIDGETSLILTKSQQLQSFTFHYIRCITQKRVMS